MVVFLSQLRNLTVDLLLVVGDRVGLQVKQLPQILLRLVLRIQQFSLKSIKSVFKPSVFLNQPNVLFGQILFVLAEQIELASLGFFLSHATANSLLLCCLIIEPKFLLNKLLLLFGELIVPEELVITSSLLAKQLTLFPQLIDLKL